MKLVNITVELTGAEQSHYFEIFLRQQVVVKDYRIIPDTKELYKSDPTYKRLVDASRKAKRIINNYINEHNTN